MNKIEKSNIIEAKILDYLKENPSGSTITDISTDLHLHRNTISKYITKLNLEHLIKIKKLGRYKLCYSPEDKIFTKNAFIPIYKGILHGLKKYFPNKEETFKQIGKELIDYSHPIMGNILNIINELKKGFSLKRIIDVFEDMYQGIFQDSIILKNVGISKDGRRISLHYTNSTFLENSEDFIYHIYMLSGFIEALLEQVDDKPYLCEIEDYKIFDDKKDSYASILIQIVRD